MEEQLMESTRQLIKILCLKEEPLGIIFTNEKPEPGFGLKASELPTREKELKNEVNWQSVFSSFGCVLGNIRRARRKGIPAYFSKEQFGCVGGAFWLGFLKPQTEMIIHYVSTGIPGKMEGERYCNSPEQLRKIFETVDPELVDHDYVVFKPLHMFSGSEKPTLVLFFASPESLSGLHQLATFVTGDPEVVASPFSAACGSLVVWPMHYLKRGLTRAVIGGWDPSARKYFNKDELSFTVPFELFTGMVNQHQDSFLKMDTWAGVQKRIVSESK